MMSVKRRERKRGELVTIMCSHRFREQTVTLSYARAADNVTLFYSKFGVSVKANRIQEARRVKSKETHDRELHQIMKLLMDPVGISLDT
jgi:hypothetical protein